MRGADLLYPVKQFLKHAVAVGLTKCLGERRAVTPHPAARGSRLPILARGGAACAPA
jgi:hypothetical protein